MSLTFKKVRFAIAALLALASPVAHAATFMVTTAADSGPGSLRAGVSAANVNGTDDTITFAPSLAGQTIRLTTGSLLIDEPASLTITAEGLTGGVTVSGAGVARVFELIEDATVVLDSLTITDGLDDFGGGIHSEANLTLRRCFVTRNTARSINGGGLFQFRGFLTIDRTTFAENAALGFDEASGGGAYLYLATADIINSTFSGNSAVAANGNAFGGALRQDGGGISILHCTFVHNHARGLSSFGGAWLPGGQGSVSHSIFADNEALYGPDLYTGLSAIISDGYNFVGNGTNSFGLTNGVNGDRVGVSGSPLDPLLGPLQPQGGFAPTHAPRAASPVIDAGSSSNSSLATDQRGLPRLADGRSTGTPRLDLGAVEAGPALFVTTASDDTDGLHAGGVSLREALANAKAPGTRIHFDSAAFAVRRIELDPLKGPLVIRSGVVSIDATGLGSPLVLSGRNAIRILEVSNGATLTLSGIRLANGLSDTGGGLRCAAGSSVSLDQCAIESCTATDSGGAMANSGRLSLHDSQLLQNTALRGHGGALDNAGGDASLVNCVLSDNSAAVGDGGGIRNTAGARLRLVQCSVQNNSAAGSGGGLFNGGANTPAEAVIRYSTFAYNTSGQPGGGVANSNLLGITHTLIACNRRGSRPDDFAGSAVSDGFNLLGTTAGAAGFTGNGEVKNVEARLRAMNSPSGLAFAPEAGSPAIDAGFDAAGGVPDRLVYYADLPARDLSGLARVVNSTGGGFRPDIGAVELQAHRSFAAGGVAWPIPGRIEAEDFDMGGAEVAYHDSTEPNTAGAHRPEEGVDIEPTTDTGGGFDVTAPAGGEWMKYTIDVRASGRYTLLLRLASDFSSGAMRVEIDGIDLTGRIAIPETGGEQDWTTIARTGLELTAGRHVMRVVWVAGVANLNWFEWQAEAAQLGLTRLLYLDRGGASISDFYAGPRGQANFPATPAPFGGLPLESGRVSKFETPPDLADSYGVVLAGYLAPSQPGWYTFYLCADNEGELWLSTDDNPANSSRVATEPVGNPARTWVNGTGRAVANGLPENISFPVFLEAGRRYYVEAIAKEGDGIDNLAVTWRRAGEPAPTNGTPPIGESWLRPRLAREPASPSGGEWFVSFPRIEPTFQSLNPAQPGAFVEFRAFASVNGPVSYEWLFNGQPIAGTNFSGTNSAVLKIVDPSPVLAGLYTVVLRGPTSTNASVPAVLGVQNAVSPDTDAPAIAITSPLPAVATSANVNFPLGGTAADNRGLLAVLISGDNFTNRLASGTTIWSFDAPLNVGTNRFAVRAVDLAGNVSAFVTRAIFRPDTNRLRVQISGLGSVSPNLTNASIFAGRSYSLVATPRPGYVFSHWDGDVKSPSSVLKFVMRPGLELTAHFVPNPFAPRKGVYTGLFYQTNEVRHESSGLVTAAVTDVGGFSGKIAVGGQTLRFSGRFSLAGVTTLRLARRGTTPLSLELRLPSENFAQFLGGLSDGSWVAELLADRAAFNSADHAPSAGRHTIVLPASGDPRAPGGDSFGALAVNAAGKITFAGTLADGTTFSQSSLVAKDGEWPFYAPLYAGKGSIIGWLTFATNNPTQSLHGLVSWTKPALSAAKAYPGGFITEMWAAGSTYAPPRTNGVLLFSNAVVQFTGGSLANSPLPFSIGLTARNTILSTNGNALTMSFSTASGLFRGTFRQPGLNQALTFRGTVLQQTNRGAGFFLNGAVSGGVDFQETP